MGATDKRDETGKKRLCGGKNFLGGDRRGRVRKYDRASLMRVLQNKNSLSFEIFNFLTRSWRVDGD